MQVAFVSSSSFAAMPVAMRSITHNLGVSKDYAAFAVPLGASIKMDGCGAILCRWRCVRSRITWVSARITLHLRCRWAPASRWTAAAPSFPRCAQCSLGNTPGCH
ncbi:dicarboxylate/amino acid:cation symporter, partial [Xanthomonas vasicola]